MEINLTAIWETVTAPFRAILRLVTRRARSRRSLANRLNPAEKKLRTIRLVRMAAIFSLAAVLLGTLAFFLAFAVVAKDLPKPGEVVRKTGFSTKIFDRNGKLLYDLHADERREPVTIDQIPDTLKKATVSTEDKDFYKHGGFDPLTPFRIVYNYIFRGGRLVGGSTLTQQLVKNALLTNERSITRKFKEFVLSIQIERKFTKDQILEMYFNETPYGGNAAGAGAAAQMYFGKPVSQLNLVESAILAGLPQSPTRYSPFAGRKDTDGTPLWKARAIGVLRRMTEDGHITKDQADQAVKDLDNVTFQSPQTGINAPHFVFYVRDQLEKQFGEDVVAKGGLQVTTTLDLDLQNKAQDIVKTEIDKVKAVDISNGSAMVMDPKNGEILSMVGSADYNNPDIDGQFNVAVDGLRQPGSSIKPVTYLAMFRKGYTPSTMLADVPTTFQRNAQEKKYEPGNYDGKFRGPVNLRNSLGSSLNIPSVKSLAIGGLDNFLSLAYEMGFPTLEPTQENMQRFGLSVTLGGAEVHLIDTMSAYSAFANGGTKVQPVAILKVADSSGNTMFEFHPVQGKRVISEEEAFLVDNVLSDNNARLIAFGPNSLLNTGKAIAVKTGTTNDKRDNWAVGWSQEFIVGVWVGNNDFKAMKQVASGISGASPIWRKLVTETMARGYKAPDWKVPPGVDQVEVDNISGYPKHDDFPSHTEYVIHGTLPALPDPIHSKLKVCRGENKLATDAKIAAGDYDEKEYIVLKEDDPWSQDGVNRWQDGINAWIGGQSDDKYKPPTEYCGSTSDTFVRLGKPNDQTKYDKEDIDVEIDADSGDGIEKIELWVDNNVKEVINNKSYRGTIHLSAGRHEVFAKAKSRAGKEVQSGTAHIGTGGQDWKAPDVVPTPTPSPSPVVVPSPTPSVLPSATPLLPNGSPHP
jgi:penicillin-binding protein 1C